VLSGSAEYRGCAGLSGLSCLAGDFLAIPQSDGLRAAFFYGVTPGRNEMPERIAYAREPGKLTVILGADEVVQAQKRAPR
jgi:hypothetical protein